MRSYYYYDHSDGPARKRPQPRRRGGGAAVALYLCALALLVGGAVLLRLWDSVWLSDMQARFRPSEKGQTVETAPARPSRLERAPTGDGTTLAISPLPEGEPHSFQQIYQENIASVVGILGEGDTQWSYGTGVVMTADGYVITNAHVIADCFSVEVALQSGERLKALLVGQDTASDLAVLKVEAEDLVPAVFGDSDTLQVGDTVLAIGNPLGEELRGTMTDGIISAINRDVNVDGYTMSLLQTTAALNQGNSGGALINEYGQAVGITNLKMGSYDSLIEGLGFAIPTTTVKSVVDQLIDCGEVTGRPTIGITVTTVTEATAQALDIPQGVRVESVEPDGPAFGVLQPGDVIVEADGAPVQSTDELLAAKDALAAGETLALRLWRSGVWLEREVTLAEQSDLAG